MTTTEASPGTRRAVAGLRLLLGALPAPLRRRLEDRLFYAVHQLTRVTNDHYPGAGAMPQSRRAEPSAVSHQRSTADR